MSQLQVPKLNAHDLWALRNIANNYDPGRHGQSLYAQDGSGWLLEERGFVTHEYFKYTDLYKFTITQAGRDYLDGLGED